MFFRKVGQITHDQTPNTIRNQDTRLDTTTQPVSARALPTVTQG
jgi:hypothetical protein